MFVLVYFSGSFIVYLYIKNRFYKVDDDSKFWATCKMVHNSPSGRFQPPSSESKIAAFDRGAF